MRASLARMLAEHPTADATEEDHRQRMLELLGAAGNPFARTHFRPGHFTASAFVISPDDSALLLILHGKLGMWLQPGGHIDADDDDVTAAARREVTEETGIWDLEALEGAAPLLDLDIHPIPANPRKNEPGHEHFDFRFLLVAKPGQPHAVVQDGGNLVPPIG